VSGDADRQRRMMIAAARPHRADRNSSRSPRQYCARARRAGSARHPEANDRLSLVALFGAAQSLSGCARCRNYNEPYPADARQKSSPTGRARAGRRRQQRFMIELTALPGRDSWALAQLCFDHNAMCSQIISCGLW